MISRAPLPAALLMACCVMPVPRPSPEVVLEVTGTLSRRYVELESPERGRIRLPDLGTFVEGMNGCVLVDETRGLASLRMFEARECSLVESAGMVCIVAHRLTASDGEWVSVDGCLWYRPRPLG